MVLGVQKVNMARSMKQVSLSKVGFVDENCSLDLLYRLKIIMIIIPNTVMAWARTAYIYSLIYIPTYIPVSAGQSHDSRLCVADR